MSEVASGTKVLSQLQLIGELLFPSVGWMVDGVSTGMEDMTVGDMLGENPVSKVVGPMVGISTLASREGGKLGCFDGRIDVSVSVGKVVGKELGSFDGTVDGDRVG
jgi:hypothetical protein